jgi:hypothetical protein
MHLSGENKIGNSAFAPQPASDCCLRSVHVLIEFNSARRLTGVDF